MVLELKTACKKVTDLETKIQRMEEQQTEQNRGELFFIMILYLTPIFGLELANLKIIFMKRC